MALFVVTSESYYGLPILVSRTDPDENVYDHLGFAHAVTEVPFEHENIEVVYVVVNESWFGTCDEFPLCVFATEQEAEDYIENPERDMHAFVKRVVIGENTP